MEKLAGDVDGLASALEEGTYTPKALAEELGVARATVDSWLHRGRIRAVRLGASVLIPRGEVDRYLIDRGSS